MLWRTERITIRVDEAVMRAARVHAAERGTTVDTLVNEFLARLANQERVRAARRTGELSEQSAARISLPRPPEPERPDESSRAVELEEQARVDTRPYLRVDCERVLFLRSDRSRAPAPQVA